MKLPNNLYFLIIFALSVLQSCYKPKPETKDFHAVKASLLAWNESTVIVDIAQQALQPLDVFQWDISNFSVNLINATSPTDSNQIKVVFDSTLLMNDNHRRKGGFTIKYLGNASMDTNVFVISFNNYFSNGVAVNGKIIIKEDVSGTLGQVQAGVFPTIIAGNVVYTLFSGEKIPVTLDLKHSYQLTKNSAYTGIITGKTISTTNFATSTENIMYKSSSFNTCNTFFFTGKYLLTEGDDTGLVWYGYKDQCDNYGFTDWTGSQFNFFLEDY